MNETQEKIVAYLRRWEQRDGRVRSILLNDYGHADYDSFAYWAALGRFHDMYEDISYDAIGDAVRYFLEHPLEERRVRRITVEVLVPNHTPSFDEAENVIETITEGGYTIRRVLSDEVVHLAVNPDAVDEDEDAYFTALDENS